jgi:hypothetical protein
MVSTFVFAVVTFFFCVRPTDQLTHPMEQNPWEANSSSAGQEISRMFITVFTSAPLFPIPRFSSCIFPLRKSVSCMVGMTANVASPCLPIVIFPSAPCDLQHVSRPKGLTASNGYLCQHSWKHRGQIFCCLYTVVLGSQSWRHVLVRSKPQSGDLDSD